MAVQISGNDITVPRDGSFTRNVTIGGTLTYEDVTNIDSVGLITARNGIEIGARPGVAASISVDGNMIVSGISTFGGAANFAAISGTTGNFSSNVDVAGELTVAETIAHTGDTNNKISFPSADTITATTAGSERVRIDSNGDIGVNVTTINRSDAGRNTIQFDYSGSDGSEGLEIRLSNSALNGNAATDNAAITYIGQNLGISNRENGLITFSNNGSERARIDSSGRFMIGTTTEGFAGADELTLATSGSTGITIRSGTSNDGNIYFSDGDDGSSAEYQGYVQYEHAHGRINFGTGATTRVKIDGANLNITNGNLKFETAGKGIDFSAQTATSASGASATSEVLDHYEEGTWTPTLTTSNGGAFSSSHAYGYYTRVGRIVHAHFVFNSYSGQSSDMLGSGASSDGVTGGGLPFPSANNSQEYYHGDIGFYAANFPGSLSLGTPSMYAYQGSNSSNFYFYLPNDNAASQLIQVTQFGQAYIRGCLHYLTAY